MSKTKVKKKVFCPQTFDSTFDAWLVGNLSLRQLVYKYRSKAFISYIEVQSFFSCSLLLN